MSSLRFYYIFQVCKSCKFSHFELICLEFLSYIFSVCKSSIIKVFFGGLVVFIFCQFFGQFTGWSAELNIILPLKLWNLKNCILAESTPADNLFLQRLFGLRINPDDGSGFEKSLPPQLGVGRFRQGCDLRVEVEYWTGPIIAYQWHSAEKIILCGISHTLKSHFQGFFWSEFPCFLLQLRIVSASGFVCCLEWPLGIDSMQRRQCSLW